MNGRGDLIQMEAARHNEAKDVADIYDGDPCDGTQRWPPNKTSCSRTTGILCCLLTERKAKPPQGALMANVLCSLQRQLVSCLASAGRRHMFVGFGEPLRLELVTSMGGYVGEQKTHGWGEIAVGAM